MHAGEMCTHHTRVEMHLVCLGVWRVVFWPSWCFVHHTTMTPFKRSRRGEWAYACWRDVHSPHTSRDAPCVFGSMACCFLAKLVLCPPHYHDTFQTFQTWRVGVCMLARCPLTTHESRCTLCVWEYGVLFFGQVGALSTTLP